MGITKVTGHATGVKLQVNLYFLDGERPPFSGTKPFHRQGARSNRSTVSTGRASRSSPDSTW